MSRRHHATIGDSKVLQRKIPSNSRYDDVQPRVNTGSSVNRYMKKIEDMQTNYRYKKDELFKRMKATTLAQLVLQVANISMQDEDGSVSDLLSARSEPSSEAPHGNGVRPDTMEHLKGSEDEDTKSPRSSLQSVIRGMGEIAMHNSGKPKPVRPETPFIEKPYLDCPYLMLDVRNEDDFEACHIIGAKHFPVAMLSRTMNNFTREILDYKNCVGRIIILYDEDERTAPGAATTMVERGFDNIFLLSGGLKVLAQKFPDGIVTGSYPASCRPPVVTTRGGRSKVVAPPSEQPANSHKVRFSPDDLDRINHYLNESLVPQDTGSRLSRLTNPSTTPAHSRATSTSTTTTNSSRRAWR